MLIVGSDSHTPSHGALGAFATGVGSTDLAAAWVAGKTWLRVPETIRVELDGRLQHGVYAKDVMLETARLLGALTVQVYVLSVLNHNGHVQMAARQDCTLQISMIMPMLSVQ